LNAVRSEEVNKPERRKGGKEERKGKKGRR
jgi:hypothetical protein